MYTGSSIIYCIFQIPQGIIEKTDVGNTDDLITLRHKILISCTPLIQKIVANQAQNYQLHVQAFKMDENDQITFMYDKIYHREGLLTYAKSILEQAKNLSLLMPKTID
jgi:hypothetical protein